MNAHVTTLSQTRDDGRLDATFHVAAAPYSARCEELKGIMTPSEAAAKLQAFPEALVRQACSALARTERGKADTRQIQSGAQAHPFLAIAMIEAALPNYLSALEAREADIRQTREQLEATGQSLSGLGRRPKP